MTSVSGYAQMALLSDKQDLVLKAATAFKNGVGSLQTHLQNIQFCGREPVDSFVPMFPYQSAQLVSDILKSYLAKRNISIVVRNKANHAIRGNTLLLFIAMLIYVLDASERLIQQNSEGTIYLYLSDNENDLEIVFSDTSELPQQIYPLPPRKNICLTENLDPRKALAPLAFETIASIHGGSISCDEKEGRSVVIMRFPRELDFELSSSAQTF